MANLNVELESLKSRFAVKNSKPTISDFAALVGVFPACVRVAGFGQRGLRWSVLSADENTGKVKLSSNDEAGTPCDISVDFTYLVIAPCSDSRRRG